MVLKSEDECEAARGLGRGALVVADAKTCEPDGQEDGEVVEMAVHTRLAEDCLGDVDEGHLIAAGGRPDVAQAKKLDKGASCLRVKVRKLRCHLGLHVEFLVELAQHECRRATPDQCQGQ